MTLTLTATKNTLKAKASAARVLEVWALATATERDHGINWYRTANALARRLDPNRPELAAGVIAALSPMMDWDRNIMLAIRAYEDGESSGALFSNVAKANAIMAGADPLKVLGGKKVRNFYAAIADPESDTAVCIDRHAFDVAMGRVTNDKTRTALARVGVYEEFQDAYRRAAATLTKTTGDHYTPAMVQATTWVTWRRLKGL